MRGNIEHDMIIEIIDVLDTVGCSLKLSVGNSLAKTGYSTCLLTSLLRSPCSFSALQESVPSRPGLSVPTL